MDKSVMHRRRFGQSLQGIIKYFVKPNENLASSESQNIKTD